MDRKTIVSRIWAAVLVAALALGAAPPAVAGESLDFGALYIGEYSDEDMRVFNDRMTSLGWYREVYKTSHAASSLNRPRHYHFTHGPYDNQYEAGDDCDILYVSGHGWKRAKLPIYDNRTVVVDSISADTNNVGGSSVHTWEVGVDWYNQFPSNESRWDYDIEWAILAACNQLDYRTTWDRLAYSNSAPRNSAAKTWGRTLLGTPSRMHAIFGYWDVAPAGSYDTYVMLEFLSRAIDYDESIGTAWAQANSKYGWSWAFVTHAENRNDRLHGQGSGATPDTSPYALYHIDYYKSGLAARMLDGRGGAYERLSDAGQTDGIVNRLRDVLGLSSAHAAGQDRRPVEAKGRRFRMPTRARGEGKRHRRVRIEPLRLDPQVLLEDEPVSIESSQTSRGRVREARGASHGPEGGERALVHEGGAFEYHSGRGVGTHPARGGRDDAVRVARTRLEELHPSFADARPAEVHEITRQRIDPESDVDEPEQVIGYSVRFAQQIDGQFVDGAGTGLTVTVDGDGVSDVSGYWLDERTAMRGAGRERPLAARQALERATKEIGRAIKLSDGDHDLRSADVVLHVNPEMGGELVPVWRYETEEGAVFFVDLESGEPLE